MLKRKLVHILVYPFMLLSIVGLIHNNTLRTTVGASIVDTYADIEKEWWIEAEITSGNGDQQEVNDEILVLLYDDFLSYRRDEIKSWHFFREPTLRFRIELMGGENRDHVAAELETFLDSIELVEDHYFARHGERIANLDEGYSGEHEQYGRMWPYQKKLWEWGCEMTVDAIKELEETGTNEPSREYQLERIFHLLSNQLSPGYENRRLMSYLLLAGISAIVALAVSAFCSIKILKIKKTLEGNH